MIFKPTYKLDFDKENLSGFTGWKSPSNIALIKYWGKKELQIPMNPKMPRVTRGGDVCCCYVLR